MSSKVNPAAINVNFPTSGVNNSIQGFQTNYLAIKNNFSQYVAEMNDLINKAIVSAPLLYGNNSNINNFGGMPITNVSIGNFAYTAFNEGTISSSQPLNIDFSLGAYHSLDIEGSATTVSLAPINFPNIGYSEIVIDVTTVNAPQFVDLSAFSSLGSINAGQGVPGFNTTTNVFTLGANCAITLGSIDGKNWNISARSNSGAVAKSKIPPSIGNPGDTAGQIAFSPGFIYVCVANYDGVSIIWQKAVLNNY